MASPARNRRAAQRLATAPDRIRELRNTIVEEMRDAQSWVPPRRAGVAPTYTPAGVAELRRQKVWEIRNDRSADVEAFADELEADLATVTAWADSARPTANDPAALMRQQYAWDRVRLLAEKGKSLLATLADADLDTALAIREWGPTWLEAGTYPRQELDVDPVPFDAAALLRAVDDRLMVVADPSVAEALQALRAAEVAAAQSRPILAITRSLVRGTTGPDGEGLVTAAIESHYAGLDAGYVPQPTTAPRREQDDDGSHDSEAGLESTLAARYARPT